MKKVLIFLILLYGHLFAVDISSALKVYNKVFPILVHKPTVRVYTDNQEYKNIFKQSKKIILEESPEKADIIFVTKKTTILEMIQKQSFMQQKKKPVIFVSNYRLLKYSSDIVGAFYWRKGRSQLLFIEKRLTDHNITLPKEYESFLVDEL